ncbi:MAG: aminoacyl-tRNA hydrolase [Clostridiales bacterium]|nr:aminoacyl-tRNA hydrolase [Clostridiales bacterium]
MTLFFRKKESFDGKNIWLVVGLGNPGAKYTYTWHNCGFLCTSILAERNNISVTKVKFKGYYGKGKIAGEDAIILRPTTFMNNSGESVIEAMKFFKVDPAHLIIVYDDIDIPVGKIRVRPSGSAGTHNGMKSVIYHTGTQDFPRVRIGCGPVPEKWNLVDFVLSDIFDDKKEIMFDSFTEGAKAVEKYIEEHKQ